jgi:hypothetical protein
MGKVLELPHVLMLIIGSEQPPGLKRKHQGGDVFTPDKKQKRQLRNKMNYLRIEDTAFSYPITKSQVLLFNAVAAVLSCPILPQSAEMRVNVSRLHVSGGSCNIISS